MAAVGRVTHSESHARPLLQVDAAASAAATAGGGGVSGDSRRIRELDPGASREARSHWQQLELKRNAFNKTGTPNACNSHLSLSLSLLCWWQSHGLGLFGVFFRRLHLSQ